jgi:hypothetical protein
MALIAALPFFWKGNVVKLGVGEIRCLFDDWQGAD